MRIAAIALILASGSLLAQRNAVSPSGFGRVMFPGGGPTGAYGGAPAANPYGSVLFPGTGAPAAIRPGAGYAIGGGGNYVPPRPPNVGHGGHGNSVVVPYPVFYGGGYYNYDAPYANYGIGQGWPTPGQPGFSTSSYSQPNYAQPVYASVNQSAQQQQDPSPVVVINQYFRPDAAPTTQPASVQNTTSTLVPQSDAQAAPLSSDMQNIFLIAMKDHTIYAANSYWVENNTLNYITVQGTENSVSLDLVDRDMSQRLNRDRKVSFGLPKN